VFLSPLPPPPPSPLLPNLNINPCHSERSEESNKLYRTSIYLNIKLFETFVANKLFN
jgi:hypothetical protein